NSIASSCRTPHRLPADLTDLCDTTLRSDDLLDCARQRRQIIHERICCAASEVHCRLDDSCIAAARLFNDLDGCCCRRCRAPCLICTVGTRADAVQAIATGHREEGALGIERTLNDWWSVAPI